MLALVGLLMLSARVFAALPDISQIDAGARAAGNLKTLARQVGDRIFSTVWPAQVTQISADGITGHLVIGVRISGVKFHAKLSQAGFVREVDQVVNIVFGTAPDAEEVDIWAVIPIHVPKNAIVSGPLAVPTFREVFTLAVRRGRNPATTQAYWDQNWVRSAFNNHVS
jgi:hypothetical protein